MRVEIVPGMNEWLFLVEHMGRKVSGWSLDEQGARHAAEKSREFLMQLAILGLDVDGNGDAETPQKDTHDTQPLC